MTRDEAKLLIRLEVERDLSLESRKRKIFPFGNKLYSASDLLAEVESGTELGNFVLDDFIAFKNGDITSEDLTVPEHAAIIQMMEDDLKIAPPGWENQVLFRSNGKAWTPVMIMEEVRNRTPFGLRFMKTYYDNHVMLEKLLGKDYLKADASEAEALLDLFALPPTRKSGNDKAN